MYKYVVSFVLLISMSQALGNVSPADNGPYVGDISAKQLLNQYPEFKQNYHAYQPSTVEKNAVKSIQGKSLVVLFGTWCHDSEREVPRLLKLLEVAAVNLASLSLVAVDRSKQDPAGTHSKFDLKYTPTFILLDGDIELGRVIESPTQSLGEDLAKLLKE
ncbi:thioredoxin [Paraglaciecola aquimarina]|uniref:Thioredoxin n=1 Tax=Paraglaciecola aquimarina TaxID=1235557 RepID=A0ABU3SRX6_9ALTE|nr:thioredoxin [Paraglaciecola aquimarina]MDU0352774.1 thioredoxin [Paraglaciecola aquimarina]